MIKKQLNSFGEHCSLTERRADEATRDVINWLKCEFLSSRVGEKFDGTISTVTGFGLFVQLDDMYIEGLIHITSLPKDYYQYEEDHHRLVGEKTRKIFRLGDNLKVKVIRVELNERKIDFELIEKNKDTDTKISTSSFDRKVKNKRKKIENKIKTKK